jgi:AraC-like DNA-binding protein
MAHYDKQNSPLLVSNEMLLGCSEAANELGIDLNTILKEHGMESGLLSAPKVFLNHHQVIGFLQAVAEHFDCQHFGLLVGKHQPPLSFGLLAQVIRLSPDLRTALEKGMLYESFYSQLVGHSLIVEDGYAQFTRWDRRTYPGSAAQLHTIGIVQLYKILKAICGSSWSATSVSFAFPKPRELRQYQRFFSCPVDFHQEFDGIVFPENDLATPIATADAELLDILCNHLDKMLAEQPREDAFIREVHNFMRLKMTSRHCNLESCARQFGMHPRTLQRALAKHEVNFTQLLSKTRMEVAEQYLQDSTIPLEELSGILGYRNRSAFSRAFKRSHGESPEQWRNSRASLTSSGREKA